MRTIQIISKYLVVEQVGIKMKFCFKIQQYQTDAVDAVAKIFKGQSYSEGISYLRDVGTKINDSEQMSLAFSNSINEDEVQDLIDDSGFKNAAVQLTEHELLKNIQELQRENNIHSSSQLVDPLGLCSLDIEM